MRFSISTLRMSALIAAALLVGVVRTGSGQAQQGTIAGTVTDQAGGLPLAGVRVSILNTNRSALTNQEGHYTLTGVPVGTHQVQTSLVGYGAATGTARFAVVNDTILSYRIDLASIDSTTLSHIHLGDAATSGGVIVTLFVGPTACTAATVASPRCRAGYTGPLPPAQLKVSQLTQLPAGFGTTPRARFDSLLVLMRNGGVYVNVHNRANPAGHIRGQTQPL